MPPLYFIMMIGNIGCGKSLIEIQAGRPSVLTERNYLLFVKIKLDIGKRISILEA